MRTRLEGEVPNDERHSLARQRVVRRCQGRVHTFTPFIHSGVTAV